MSSILLGQIFLHWLSIVLSAHSSARRPLLSRFQAPHRTPISLQQLMNLHRNTIYRCHSTLRRNRHSSNLLRSQSSKGDGSDPGMLVSLLWPRLAWSNRRPWLCPLCQRRWWICCYRRFGNQRIPCQWCRSCLWCAQAQCLELMNQVYRTSASRMLLRVPDLFHLEQTGSLRWCLQWYLDDISSWSSLSPRQ